MSTKIKYLKDENGDVFSPIVSLGSVIWEGGGKLHKSLLDLLHPIGEYYETSNTSFDPNVSWGGTWVKETDERVLKTAEKLLGHKCFVTDWDKAKEKEYLTKKLRNSFNTSKPEIKLFNDLKSQYGEDNVVSQYQDYRYKNPKLVACIIVIFMLNH